MAYEIDKSFTSPAEEEHDFHVNGQFSVRVIANNGDVFDSDIEISIYLYDDSGSAKTLFYGSSGTFSSDVSSGFNDKTTYHWDFLWELSEYLGFGERYKINVVVRNTFFGFVVAAFDWYFYTENELPVEFFVVNDHERKIDEYKIKSDPDLVFEKRLQVKSNDLENVNIKIIEPKTGATNLMNEDNGDFQIYVQKGGHLDVHLNQQHITEKELGVGQVVYKEHNAIKGTYLPPEVVLINERYETFMAPEDMGHILPVETGDIHYVNNLAGCMMSDNKTWLLNFRHYDSAATQAYNYYLKIDLEQFNIISPLEMTDSTLGYGDFVYRRLLNVGGQIMGFRTANDRDNYNVYLDVYDEDDFINGVSRITPLETKRLYFPKLSGHIIDFDVFFDRDVYFAGVNYHDPDDNRRLISFYRSSDGREWEPVFEAGSFDRLVSFPDYVGEYFNKIKPQDSNNGLGYWGVRFYYDEVEDRWLLTTSGVYQQTSSAVNGYREKPLTMALGRELSSFTLVAFFDDEEDADCLYLPSEYVSTDYVLTISAQVTRLRGLLQFQVPAMNQVTGSCAVWQSQLVAEETVYARRRSPVMNEEASRRCLETLSRDGWLLTALGGSSLPLNSRQRLQLTLQGHLAASAGHISQERGHELVCSQQSSTTPAGWTRIIIGSPTENIDNYGLNIVSDSSNFVSYYRNITWQELQNGEVLIFRAKFKSDDSTNINDLTGVQIEYQTGQSSGYYAGIRVKATDSRLTVEDVKTASLLADISLTGSFVREVIIAIERTGSSQAPAWVWVTDNENALGSMWLEEHWRNAASNSLGNILSHFNLTTDTTAVNDRVTIGNCVPPSTSTSIQSVFKFLTYWDQTSLDYSQFDRARSLESTLSVTEPANIRLLPENVSQRFLAGFLASFVGLDAVKGQKIEFTMNESLWKPSNIFDKNPEIFWRHGGSGGGLTLTLSGREPFVFDTLMFLNFNFILVTVQGNDTDSWSSPAWEKKLIIGNWEIFVVDGDSKVDNGLLTFNVKSRETKWTPGELVGKYVVFTHSPADPASIFKNDTAFRILDNSENTLTIDCLKSLQNTNDKIDNGRWGYIWDNQHHVEMLDELHIHNYLRLVIPENDIINYQQVKIIEENLYGITGSDRFRLGVFDWGRRLKLDDGYYFPKSTAYQPTEKWRSTYDGRILTTKKGVPGAGPIRVYKLSYPVIDDDDFAKLRWAWEKAQRQGLKIWYAPSPIGTRRARLVTVSSLQERELVPGTKSLELELREVK